MCVQVFAICGIINIQRRLIKEIPARRNFIVKFAINLLISKLHEMSRVQNVFLCLYLANVYVALDIELCNSSSLQMGTLSMARDVLFVRLFERNQMANYINYFNECTHFQ